MIDEDDKIPGITGIHIEAGSKPVTAPDHLDSVECSRCGHSFSKHYFNPCAGIKNNGDPCNCTEFQD